MTTNVRAFTKTEVLDIRRLVMTRSQTSLANDFNVSRKTIYNIANNLLYKDVPAPQRAKGFKNYEIYPDGRVWSVSKDTFVTPKTSNLVRVVKISRNDGKRVTVPVASLMKKAFNIKKG